MKIIAEGELRREVNRPDLAPVVPEEAMPREALIASYTVERARSWGDSDRGMIAPGLLADFSVFDQDIFEVAAEDLPNIKVVATFVDGKVVSRN